MKVMWELWPRAFAKSAREFKELFGVKKEIFQKMHTVLVAAYEERPRKGGRDSKLSVRDQLLLHPVILAGISDNGPSRLGLHENSRISYKKSKNHPLTVEQKRLNRELSRERIVIENNNARIKTFKILSKKVSLSEKKALAENESRLCHTQL